MKKTIEIDDELLRELKQRAARENLPLDTVLNTALRKGLWSLSTMSQLRGEQVFSMGQPLFNVDKALEFAADLEDEEILKRLAQGK
jgi:hypothetical protein